jgi:hypothetical protein
MNRFGVVPGVVLLVFRRDRSSRQWTLEGCIASLTQVRGRITELIEAHHRGHTQELEVRLDECERRTELRARATRKDRPADPFGPGKNPQPVRPSSTAYGRATVGEPTDR